MIIEWHEGILNTSFAFHITNTKFLSSSCKFNFHQYMFSTLYKRICNLLAQKNNSFNQEINFAIYMYMYHHI